ncbi:MAG: hypothetical protein ABI607_03715 [Betaproteobacteria bacterium]
MNKYQPLTPRTSLGVIAFAMTLATFGLCVAAPAALATKANDGMVATRTAPAAITVSDLQG